MPRIGTLPLAVFAACGSPSRGQLRRPSLSGRQVLLFRASACDELTPPIHRAPPGPHTGSSPTEGPPQASLCPETTHRSQFRCHRCFISMRQQWFTHVRLLIAHPAPLTARRQPQRSPPRLLTDAACGGLESPPARRPRRTYLHHWHSTDRADDLLHHHHHFPSGHTWVPRNSAVVVDLPRCGPMLSPRVTASSYRFLLPGWSAKPLVSAHDRIMGTHRLPGCSPSCLVSAHDRILGHPHP